MGRFEDILLDLEELLDRGEHSKFNKSKLVYNEHDVDHMVDIVTELINNLPMELNQAKDILSRKEEIIKNAKKDAKELIADGEREVEKLVSEHEVYVAAVKKAEQIELDTQEQAKQYFFDLYTYMDEKLEETDRKLEEFKIKIDSQIKENRDIFQRIYDYQEKQLESSKECLSTISSNIAKVRTDIREGQ